jgi:hypothetical protein
VKTDTERLDAIGEHGLCISRHDVLGPNGWDERWVCHYQDRMAVAPTIREALDAAVLDITTGGQLPN